MKKCFAFCFLLAALFLLLLAACTADPSPTASEDLSAAESDESALPAAPSEATSGESGEATSDTPSEAVSGDASDEESVAVSSDNESSAGPDISADTSDSSDSSDSSDTSTYVCTCIRPDILHETGPVPPGSLPAIELIPEADSDGVGSVVTVGLAPECRLSALSFSYARNAETAKERLVIIDTHEWYSNQVAPLCVYETDFGGVQGLLDALEAGEFEAKLLARIHISEQEASSLGSTDEFAFSEYIVCAQKADGDVLFGRVLYAEKEGVLPEPYRALGDGRQAVLFRPAASPSSDMSSYISRWQRIYDRFDEKYGLNALVSVD